MNPAQGGSNSSAPSDTGDRRQHELLGSVGQTVYDFSGEAYASGSGGGMDSDISGLDYASPRSNLQRGKSGLIIAVVALAAVVGGLAWGLQNSKALLASVGSPAPEENVAPTTPPVPGAAAGVQAGTATATADSGQPAVAPTTPVAPGGAVAAAMGAGTGGLVPAPTATQATKDAAVADATANKAGKAAASSDSAKKTEASSKGSEEKAEPAKKAEKTKPAVKKAVKKVKPRKRRRRRRGLDTLPDPD